MDQYQIIHFLRDHTIEFVTIEVIILLYLLYMISYYLQEKMYNKIYTKLFWILLIGTNIFITYKFFN